MKKVVYTVLLGDYSLNEPRYINKDWHHICFSDMDHKSNIWEVRKIEKGENRKKSRHIKIEFYNYFDCDVCLYIDSKFTVKIDLDKFTKENLLHDLCLMKHNKRNCIYDEASFCISHKKDNKEVILNQIKKYRQEKFPENKGLYAPGIMIRKDIQQVRDFMNLWYNEVEKHSYRDIISFSYVLWKFPIKIDTMSFKETYMRFK